MGSHFQPTKLFNVRLPAWALEYIDRRSGEMGTTKTQVVLEALARLRADDLRGLMRAGYEEMQELDRRLAEEAVEAATTRGPA